MDFDIKKFDSYRENNCLVNTDFFMPRGIVIRKDAEKIIIENPGYIRTGKDQMLKGGISDPRNKSLMKMFNMIGIGERAGSGVPDIFAVWDSQGLVAPEIEEQYNPDRTILTLSFTEKQAETDKQQKLRKINSGSLIFSKKKKAVRPQKSQNISGSAPHGPG